MASNNDPAWNANNNWTTNHEIYRTDPAQHASPPPLHAAHGSPGPGIPLQFVVADYPGLVVRDYVPAAYAKNGVVRPGESSLRHQVFNAYRSLIPSHDRRGTSSRTMVDDSRRMSCILVRRRLSSTRTQVTGSTCRHSSSARRLSSAGCALGSQYVPRSLYWVKR
jgi:hypothetical protein